jgi:hypothetical protein
MTMITINPSLLASLGINMSTDEHKAFAGHLQVTLQERVGTAITELLDDDQAAKLVELSEKDDQAALTAWLEQNVPEYKEVIQDEYDILMGEVAENADQL